MSQPTPAPPPAPRSAPHSRASFPRWVRAVSEQQLLLAAQREVAQRYGTPAPPPLRGADAFWQRVYAPLFHRLPYPLRARIAGLMPGSHRRTWHTPQQVQGPAV